MSSYSYSDYESSLAAVAEVVELNVGATVIGPSLLASLAEVGAARDGVTEAEIQGAVLATLWKAAAEQVRRCDSAEFSKLHDKVKGLALKAADEVDHESRDLVAVRKMLRKAREFREGWGSEPLVLLGYPDGLGYGDTGGDYESLGVRTFESVAGSYSAVVMADEAEGYEESQHPTGHGPPLAAFAYFLENLESIERETQGRLNGLRARLDLLMARDQVMGDVQRAYEVLGDVPPYGSFVPLGSALGRAHIQLLASDETYVLSEIADEIKGGAGTVKEAYARVAAQLKAAAPDASLAVTKESAAVSKLNKRHHTTVAKMKAHGRRSMVDDDGRRSSTPDLSGRRLRVSIRPGGRPTID